MGSAGVISRGLVDVTGNGKKEDAYVAKTEKTSSLWRPGNGFRPTSFAAPKGPKVRRLSLDGTTRVTIGIYVWSTAYATCS